MGWHERIVSDPGICGGQACIRGTRTPVSVVLDNLAAGGTAAQIVHDYPGLALEDVRASVEYGADRVRESVLPQSISDVWTEEIVRRANALERGELPTVDGEEVFRRIRAKHTR